jgi:outer membrane protein OmpA-like peptidoglycan-associated protein
MKKILLLISAITVVSGCSTQHIKNNVEEMQPISTPAFLTLGSAFVSKESVIFNEPLVKKKENAIVALTPSEENAAIASSNKRKNVVWLLVGNSLEILPTDFDPSKAESQLDSSNKIPVLFFAFNRSYPLHRVYFTEEEVITSLKKAKLITINGYTDAIGSAKYNKKLSLKRGQNIKSWMVKNGIARKHIIVHGYGKAHPNASNNDETGRAKNRRVEVIIEETDAAEKKDAK